MRHELSCVDHQKANRDQHRRKTHAERRDQKQAKRDAMKGDGAQKNDQGGGARDHPARHAQGQKLAPGDSASGVWVVKRTTMMVIGLVPV